MKKLTSFYFAREIVRGQVAVCVPIATRDVYSTTIDDMSKIRDSGHITKEVFQLVSIDAESRDFTDRYITEYTHPAMRILTETTFAKKGTEDRMNQVATLACILASGQLYGPQSYDEISKNAISLAGCILDQAAAEYQSVTRTDKVVAGP